MSYSPNHSQKGGPQAIDNGKWRVAATVYDGNTQYVDSAGPIIVQPGSSAGPMPTNQFFYTLGLRPLTEAGKQESMIGPPEWFKPIVHGSGGTGMFDRAGYQFSPLPGPGEGGTRWKIEINNSPSTHDNAQQPYLNIYVPTDR